MQDARERTDREDVLHTIVACREACIANELAGEGPVVTAFEVAAQLYCECHVADAVDEVYGRLWDVCFSCIGDDEDDAEEIIFPAVLQPEEFGDPIVAATPELVDEIEALSLRDGRSRAGLTDRGMVVFVATGWLSREVAAEARMVRSPARAHSSSRRRRKRQAVRASRRRNRR
jgi:hypothetical protein